MTRLEKIEAWLKKVDRWNKGHIPTGGLPTTYHVQEADLLYALDCYKARAAVLEEGLRGCLNSGGCFCATTNGYDGDGTCADCRGWKALEATPEQCLERMKEAG